MSDKRMVLQTRVSTLPDHFLNLIAELLLNLLGQLLLTLLPEVDILQVRHGGGLENTRASTLPDHFLHLVTKLLLNLLGQLLLALLPEVDHHKSDMREVLRILERAPYLIISSTS
jgi:hypothetical protein